MNLMVYYDFYMLWFAGKFLSPTLLVYAGEDKEISVVEIEKNSVQTLIGHQARVKSLDFVRSVHQARVKSRDYFWSVHQAIGSLASGTYILSSGQMLKIIICWYQFLVTVISRYGPSHTTHISLLVTLLSVYSINCISLFMGYAHRGWLCIGIFLKILHQQNFLN